MSLSSFISSSASSAAPTSAATTLLVLVALLVPRAPLQAAVRMPALFSDDMVVQSGHDIPVWGWAEPHERVTVSLQGPPISTTTGADGRWRLVLPAVPAGGPYQMTITGTNSITIQDVLCGEVWLAAGQQNAEQLVRDIPHVRAITAEPDILTYRLFDVERSAPDRPAEDVKGRWQICRANGVTNQRAICYFFARELQRLHPGAVGMIDASWGGRTAEAWMPAEPLLHDPDLKPIIDRSTAELIAWAKEMVAYRAEIDAWKPQADAALAAGEVVPRLVTMSHWIRDPLAWTEVPGCTFHGMIQPLAPFPLRGVIWYHGEANVGRAWQYRKILPALIQSWRTLWHEDALPFLVVQCASSHPATAQPGESGFSELRESQRLAVDATAKTGLLVTLDLGAATSNDNAPTDMAVVAKRLAAVAQTLVYEGTPVRDSAVFASLTIHGHDATLHSAPGSHLAVSGAGELRGFSLAGADRHFVWAKARLDDGLITVWSEDVPTPVAVRYAWADNPEGCNLIDTQIGPVSTFRSDDWPLSTQAAR